jgi:parvulin-like peptidyl-prolyl isomerase
MSKWVAAVFYGLCSVFAVTVWPALGLAHHTQLRAAAITDPAELARRSEPVVSFQGGVVTIGELEDMILEQNPLMQERYQSMEAVHVLLDRSVRFALLAAEAERRGYLKAAPVVLAANQSAVQALIQSDFDNSITADSMPAADVEKYYSEHIEEFVRGEGRRVSMLLLADEAAAKALLPQAQAADLRGFRELARTQSVDETTKQRGGDLPFFDASGRGVDAKDSGVEPAVAKATFALKTVGDTSRPVQVGQRFAIIRLSGIRASVDDSLHEANDQIRQRLWRDRRQAAIDAHMEELKKQLHATVHWELIDAVKLDSGPPLPPSDGLPGGFPHTPETSPEKNSRDHAQPR